MTLGIDSSTQSCSAVVIDTNAGAVLAEESVNFGHDLPQYNAPNGFIPDGKNGTVHSDPLMWLDALELCLHRLTSRVEFSRLEAISGAGQQHGTVYLNAHWEATLAKLSTASTLAEQIEPCLSRRTSPIWMDTSTTQECREIAGATGGDDMVCNKSGSIAIERFSGPQIRRFMKELPDQYENTTRIHLVSSFLCSILAGSDAPIDHGDGAGMNLLNLKSWQWDHDLVNATAPGILEKLPDIKPSATVAGRLSSYFCEKFGFSPNIPVVTFTGDNPSSLVGMGAAMPGKVVISLGTSDTFFAALPQPLTDPDGYGHVFGNPLGGCMTLQCFLNGSLAREQTRDRFDMDWDAFSEALNDTPPGNNGNRMAPFYGPEISPRIDLQSPRMKGSAEFENWQDGPAAIRACVEGQFVNMRRRSQWMQLAPEVIYLTGGASKNDRIAQIVADVFGATVQRLAVSGSVGLGAAMRAAITGCGIDVGGLESALCQPEPGSSVLPDSGNVDTYMAMTAQFDDFLL